MKKGGKLSAALHKQLGIIPFPHALLGPGALFNHVYVIKDHHRMT
jgi:hypothetical protein